MIQPVYKYSCSWRYQFNHGKTGVVVFGECDVTHSKNIKVCQWKVGPNHIYEKSEYVNLDVFITAVDHFIEILMRTPLRPERKQECYSMLILTGEE